MRFLTVLLCCPLLLGAPAPLGPALIEGDSLRLEIKASGRLNSKKPSASDPSVFLTLTNLSKDIRAVPYLIAMGNRIEFASGPTMVFWFPDGQVVENAFDMGWADLPKGGWEAAKPLALPGGGHAWGKQYVHALFSDDKGDLRKPFAKNEGKFCLTVVIGHAGIQSNTISYNGCKLPPASYSPAKLSRNFPENVRKRREAEEKARVRALIQDRIDHEKWLREREAFKRAGGNLFDDDDVVKKPKPRP